MGSILALLLTVILLVPAGAAAQDLLVGTMPNDDTPNFGGLQRFDGTTGAYLGYFVAPGAGGLSSPVFFIFGPDRNLYVAAATAGTVKRYDGTTGAYMGDFATLDPGLYATGLAFGPDGRLYVGALPMEAGAWKVVRFDGTTGAYVDDFVPGASGRSTWLGELTFGPDGNLYVVDGEVAIQRFNGTTGESMGVFVTLNGGSPWGMKFGPDGNLYLSLFYGHSIRRYDGATGALLGTITGMSWPAGIAFGPDDKLYVAERYVNMGGRVKRFDGPTGAFIDVFATTEGGVQTELGLAWFPSPDKTPPTISAAATAAPNQAGWYNGDVTVHFTCADAGSGIPEGACPGDQILTPEGIAIESTPQTVTDAGGNTSEPSNVVKVSIDKTSPTVSLVGGPANGGTYGFGSVPAAPACAASDTLSGLNGPCGISGYATTLGSHTATATASDRADNRTSASATYTVIPAAPVITPVLTGTLGLNGWYTTNVGLTWTLVSASPVTAKAGCQARTVSANTMGVTYTCFAQNETGASGQSVTIKRDASPPSVTAAAKPAANSAGWQRTTTTVSFTCSDGTSGILSCPTAIALANEGTGQGASGTGVNNAGLQTTATARGINIDLTLPTVLIAVPANGAAYLLGSSVPASYACGDTLSGIAACTGPVANGAPINTATRGIKKFQVTGTDRAGNTTKTTFSYIVQ